jgi:thiamine-phosphate pyrophosphorylase
MKTRFALIYPITDKRMSGKPTHLAILRELVRGGAAIVQIRDQETAVGELLLDLRRCVEYAASFGVRIIVNDRCDLALLSGAAGAHLGQDDLPAAAARRILGRQAVIGVSTHSPAQVRRANLMPVQYVGFGPIFATSSKPDHAPAVGLEALRQACRQSTRPVIAIGGIGPGQIPAVLEAGAAGVAVISSLMKSKCIARRMEELLKAAGR